MKLYRAAHSLTGRAGRPHDRVAVYPKSHFVTPREWTAAAGECPFPAILKPAFSHLGVKALGAKALRCADAEELRAALATAPDVELLLQEYVPGDDDQLYTAGLFVCAEGHNAFTGRRIDLGFAVYTTFPPDM